MPAARCLPERYAWLPRPVSARQVEDRWLTEKTRESHARSKGTHGAPRIHVDLAAEGIRGAARGQRVMFGNSEGAWATREVRHSLGSLVRTALQFIGSASQPGKPLPEESRRKVLSHSDELFARTTEYVHCSHRSDPHHRRQDLSSHFAAQMSE